MSWRRVERRRGRRTTAAALAAVGLGSSLVLGPTAAAPAAAVMAPVAAVGGTFAVLAELPNPEPSPEEARRRADEILSSSAYQDPPESIGDRLLRWIWERLGDLLDGLGFAPSSAGKGANPLAWVLLVGLTVAVGFLIWRLRGSMGTRRRRVEDPLLVTELEAARTTTEWLREAERLEQAGEWKAALRCRYRALVGDLLERGLVRDLPGRTSGEFRVDVRRRAPDLAPAFTEASNLFDAAWYGDRPTSATQSRSFQHLAEEILALAPSAPVPDEPAPATVGPEPGDNQLVAAGPAPAEPTPGLATGLPGQEASAP